MTSSMLAGEKRWASGRRGGMTVLGKVAVPKPLNLPSQRLENHGLDPNVEIVPKGTFTWGSKSSSVVHPWSSSTGSFNTNLGAPSPSYLNGRPSSGGSSSRPSTAGSDKPPESGASIKGLNSRPSSASGSLTSSQASVTSLRPHSADTRTGSSQLSRFAESSSNRSIAWSGVGTAQKLEVATPRNDEFSLACGDFPSLGSEKHEFGKNKPLQVDISTRTEVDTKHVSDGEKESAPTADDSPNHHGMGSMDDFWRQTGSVPPQHVECWRGPPMGVPPAGTWFRGPPQGFPYGAPYPPGTFRPEQFPFYAPQVPVIASNSQPVHPSMPGPRGPNGEPYRPHMPDAFMPHFMAARPGYGPPPMTSDGYYVPTMNFSNPNGYHVPCMRPYVGAWHSGSNVPCNQGEAHDSWGKDHATDGNEEKKESHVTHRETSVKIGNLFGPEVRLLKGNRGTNTNEMNSTSAMSAPVSSSNSSLIQQIECLNAKARASDGMSNPCKKTELGKGKKDDSKVDGSGHATNQGGVITNVNNRKAKPSRGSATREANERTGVKKFSTEETKVNNCDVIDSSSLDDGAANCMISKPHTGVKLAEKAEMILEGKDCSVDPAHVDADGSQSQRVLMRELAKRRAKQRQEEEEQREKEQRAKALAKLEELNRRTQAAESSNVNSGMFSSDDVGHRIQEPDQECQPGLVVDACASTVTSASEPSTKQQDLAADTPAGTDDVSSKYLHVNQELAGGCENATMRMLGLPSEESREKDQHAQHRLHRSNVQPVRSRDKGRHSDTVVWAPKSRESPAESEKPDGKSRRAEMERYVPKSLARNASDNLPKMAQIEFGSFNPENIAFLSTTSTDVDSKKGNRRHTKQSHLSPPKDNSSPASEPAKNPVVKFDVSKADTEEQNDFKADASSSIRVKSPTVKEKRDHAKGQKRNFKNSEPHHSQAPPTQGVTEMSVLQWKPKAQAVQSRDNLSGKGDEPKQPVAEPIYTEKHINAQYGRRGKNMLREVKSGWSNRGELDSSESTDFQRSQKPLPSNFRKNGQQNRRLNRRQESREEWNVDGKQHGHNLHLEYQPIRHGKKRFGAAGGGMDGKVDGSGGY